MANPSGFRRVVALGFLGALVSGSSGCGGAASVEPPPTSPVLTKETTKATIANIKAQQGRMGPPGRAKARRPGGARR